MIVPLITLIPVAVGACRDGPTSQPLEASIDANLCSGTDPAPNAPGVYLGACDPYECFASWGSTGVDADGDGLEDLCEETLAPMFAPELYYDYGGDDVRGEPHWVARPTDSGTVVIGYLLSYYRDEGCRALGCGALGADRHNGDSEDIYLELYYNFSTQHWVLLQALYSQHGDYGVYSKGSDEYPTQLFYPWHPGAYPRTYVSEGKHANYSSVSECDWGDYLQDDCDDDNTSARVDTYRFGQSLNIGSSAVHSPDQDCMPSADPSYEYYGAGRIECYWTDQRFRGWVPDSVGGRDTDAYSPKLAARGF